MEPRVSINEVLVTVGKAISIKRQKAPDDSEVNVAHLKFSGVYLQREQIDKLLKRDSGWAHRSFFDEAGDPVLMLEIGAPLDVTVSGTIRGTDASCLRLMQAELTGVTLTLCRLGAKLAGELAWVAAGDEVSDVDSLLGRECIAQWEVNDGAQMSIMDSIRNVRDVPGGFAADGQLSDGTKFTMECTGPADSEEPSDELLPQAIDIVVATCNTSISFLQRQLKIGYNRAARLLEAMEASGVVGPMLPAGSREVLKQPATATH
jgi:DNA segregation ATPase FtsK/SpoIIIE-like protein